MCEDHPLLSWLPKFLLPFIVIKFFESGFATARGREHLCDTLRGNFGLSQSASDGWSNVALVEDIRSRNSNTFCVRSSSSLT